MFLVGFKAVSEPPVPQHVQRKEHVFQVLTLKRTWDLNKIAQSLFVTKS